MKLSTRKLAASAVCAAAYAALTLLLAPMSFGVLQLRVSEALCILPAFIPCASWGLFIGCAIANLASSAGLMDIIFGSLATLGACLFIVAISGRGARPLSWPRSAAVCLMPALWNGPVIGAMLAYVTMPAAVFWQSFAAFGAQIAAEEAVVLLAVGLPLIRLLPKSREFTELVDKINRE